MREVKLFCCFIILCKISIAQDTIKLFESTYRLSGTNYSWQDRNIKTSKWNLDSVTCFAEKVLLDTLSGNNIYRHEIIDCKLMQQLEKEKDSLDKIFNNVQGHYVQFYYDNDIIKEEGKWYYEYWEGEYKRYYPNSKMAETGSFMNDSIRNKILVQLSEKKQIKWWNNGWLIKIGKWEYYSVNGVLTKVEFYDDIGRLKKVKSLK